MPIFSQLKPMATTLRVMSALLSYPDAHLRDDLSALRDALHAEDALRPERMAEIDVLVASLAGGDPFDVEAEYVHLFDRGRSTSLHLFEHVHGDSRDRGPAMIDLAQTYEKAGLELAAGELPDFLPVVLEFAATQPPREARALLGEFAHITKAIFAALVKRESRYASVLGALLDLAGEKAELVAVADDEPLDAAWEEPPAFDGCSTAGQASAGQAQPIHIHRRGDRAAGRAVQ